MLKKTHEEILKQSQEEIVAITTERDYYKQHAQTCLDVSTKLLEDYKKLISDYNSLKGLCEEVVSKVNDMVLSSAEFEKIKKYIN